MQAEIYDMDYSELVHLLGTAHFTRRSLIEAYKAVSQLKPSDLALELDLRRFRILNNACVTCPRQGKCTNKCEFIGATEALGNVDANIWLIDMPEREMARRIQTLTMTPWKRLSNISLPLAYGRDEEVQLWEEGFKDRVLNSYQRKLERLRVEAPHVRRVLIEERNTVMAARLAWIATESLRENEKPSILALVGAAHVEGIRELLKNPATISESLRRLNLSFTPPTLIRRIKINGD